ncbi:MAG TPA: mechanosensitive ion channel domain-containing protein [bacterium]|nr:mechanosensitive ion channel domain-containing protein [bacterium]
MEPDAIQSLAELFSFGRLIASGLALAMAWLAAQVVAWILRLASARFSRYRLTIGRLFPVMRLLIWGFALYFVIVVIFRPQANSVLALTASAGLAFGLAAQEIVRNILAGIFILFDEPFRVGDMVEVDGHYGEVTSIGIRSTRIHTFDDSTIAVPNGLMMSQAVSNSNSGQIQEMVVIDFTLPALADTATVKAIAAEAAASSPYIYLRRPIEVMVEDRFDRTFLTRFKIKCYVLDVRYERLLASDVLERLKGEILARGILTPEIVLGLMAVEPRTGTA